MALLKPVDIDSPPPNVDPRSAERLLVNIRPRLERVFYHFRIPPTDTDDLLQEALLALLSNTNEIHRPEEWLLATVRNQCRHFWRKHRRRLYDVVDRALLEGVAQAPAQERGASLSELRTQLAQLSPRCQTILSLRYAQGYNSVEISKRLSIGHAAARKALERCLSCLGQEISRANSRRKVATQ